MRLRVIATLHRGFCRCEPDPQAHSTELEQVPAGHQSNWSHSLAPPGNWRPRLDSASQKVALRLARRAPVAVGTPGIPGPCDTPPASRKPREKLAGSSADRSAVPPVAEPR